jgi:hypothetical protein
MTYFFDIQVGDAECARQVALRVELDVAVGVVGRAGPSGRHVDDPDRVAVGATVDDPREQQGVHLGGFVPPGDDDVGFVDVGERPGRLVDAVVADEAGDRRSHAKSGIRIDVVRRQPAL